MGGVDRNDQLRQYYAVPTKCHKYIFWFLFEVAVTNSNILHSNYSTAPQQPLKEYRLELAKGLIGDFCTKKRHSRHPAPLTNLTLLHFPMTTKHPVTSTTLRNRCWYCWFLFEVAVTNSYILHSNYSTTPQQPLKEYRLQLAKGLIGDFCTKKRHSRHPAPPTNLTLLHFPMTTKHPVTSTTLRNRCWYCWHKKNKTRSDTLWYCHECQLHFCHTGNPDTNCFLQYHCSK